MVQIFAILAVIGLACLIWLAYGWLLLPGTCPVQMVVTAAGSAEGLEQTVKGLVWLQKNHLWSGSIAIRDGGLTQEGLMVALVLARQDGIEFCGRISE